MRYTKGHRQETRRRILAMAAREFREAGLDGIGIGDLMGKLGLTHGGFYAHFKNKDALIAEVLKQGGASDSAASLREAASRALPKEELTAVIGHYLSTGHRDHPEVGCLLPALAGDVARQARPVRAAFTRSFKGLLNWLTGVKRRREVEGFDEEMIPLVATLVGAVLLARAVDDRELSGRILEVCRERLLAGLKADAQ
jgi:TetR/AcrR family transcriptional regulator, transcriptional repressor for nem operon